MEASRARGEVMLFKGTHVSSRWARKPTSVTFGSKGTQEENQPTFVSVTFGSNGDAKGCKGMQEENQPF